VITRVAHKVERGRAARARKKSGEERTRDNSGHIGERCVGQWEKRRERERERDREREKKGEREREREKNREKPKER